METLHIYDNRMLDLITWALRAKIAPNESTYLAMISFPRTNISNVRKGKQSFSREHIKNACQLTGANANWIFGLETNMMRKPAKGPIEKIKEAVMEIEALKTKPVTKKVRKKDQ